MSEQVETALPSGVGYGVVIGVGAFFTILVIRPLSMVKSSNLGRCAV